MMANEFDRNGASCDSSGGIADDIGGQCSDLCEGKVYITMDIKLQSSDEMEI